jgi:hypothetical protein
MFNVTEFWHLACSGTHILREFEKIPLRMIFIQEGMDVTGCINGTLYHILLGVLS